MLFCDVLFGVHSYLITLLISIAIIGDYVVHYSKLHIYRAFFDNFTHALIGGISWFAVCLSFRNRYSTQTLLEIALCTIIASSIDLDHFVAAQSLSLKDATNLQSRPMLHCSTLPVIFTFVVISIAYFWHIRWLWRLGLIIFTAFASHHTRDATRRGFWIYPWGSTPPIPYVLYIALTVFIPYSVCLIMKYVGFDTYDAYIRTI